MNYWVDIQHVCVKSLPIADQMIQDWINHALSKIHDSAELTIRFVDSDEMIQLNHTYRQQNKPTNVLAFPADIPQQIELDYPLLGDVIICPEVLYQECASLNRTFKAHLAHILIHGVLHLCGYDHIDASDEIKMQTLEIDILAQLGFNNPYQLDNKEILLD